MKIKDLVICGVAVIAFGGTTFAQNQDTQKRQENQVDVRTQQEVKTRANAASREGQSNEKLPQPKRIEDAYPLTSDADRAKSLKLM